MGLVIYNLARSMMETLVNTTLLVLFELFQLLNRAYKHKGCR